MTTSASTKTNLILDLTIFTAFLAASNPRITGNSIHEWLGISFAAAIITHLLFHWKWIVNVSTEFFKKLFHQSRLNFLVDSLFFIAMVGVTFSGILISKDVLNLFGISLNADQGWRMIHSATADLSVITLGIHIALHWKWITTTLNRFITSPVRSMLAARPQNTVNPPTPRGLTTQTVRINDHK